MNSISEINLRQYWERVSATTLLLPQGKGLVLYLRRRNTISLRPNIFIVDEDDFAVEVVTGIDAAGLLALVSITAATRFFISVSMSSMTFTCSALLYCL